MATVPQASGAGDASSTDDALRKGTGPSEPPIPPELSLTAAGPAAADQPTFIGAAPVEKPDAPASGVAIGASLGPYELLAKLGEGGMGAVYKARHQHLDMVVALKVLPQQLTQHAESVARFRREMKAVGRIRHPNIVQATDAGEINGMQYLAMEYVEGSDLAKLVARKGVFTITNACKAIKQAAQALAVAHQAELVHRDIKPSNLLLAKSGQIKVLDLGLALLGEEGSHTTEVTAHGQTFGTPDYMAPEQWADSHTVDARTDLYALGCTLFYLLVGRAPYADDKHRTPLNKMTGHVMEPAPDLKGVRPDVPAAVLAIYQKLMAKEREQRYQSATELIEALNRFAAGKPDAAAAPLPASPSPATGTEVASQVDLTRVNAGTAVRAADALPLFGTGTVDEMATTVLLPQRKPPGKLARRWGLLIGGTTAVVGLLGLLAIVLNLPREEQMPADGPRAMEKHATDSTSPTAGGTFALQFDGNSQVTSEPMEMLNSVVRTYEAWGTLDVLPDHRGAWLVQGFHGELTVHPDKYRFYTHHGHVESPSNAIPLKQRFHLAGVDDGKQRRLYLNGRLIGQFDGPGILQPAPELMAISLGRLWTGELDAVRISSVARYTSDFQPPDHFTADQQTEVLYNFVEGQGDVLKDTSGHNRHGKIVGAKWVRRDGESPGWQGWPADAPKPAIAPFDADQAKQHQAEWAAYLKVPVEWENSLGMKFRLIPPGEFMMGSTPEEKEEALKELNENEYLKKKDKISYWIERVQSETSQHRVVLTNPIYLSIYEVQQKHYLEVMKDNRSTFSPAGSNNKETSNVDHMLLPAESVKWTHGAEFCQKLCELEGFKSPYFVSQFNVAFVNGSGYRYPTEAEWEFACRAGTQTRYWPGDTTQELRLADWYDWSVSGGRTHASGDLQPNPFGLFDLHGNVSEWVQDGCEPGSPRQAGEEAVVNPTGLLAGDHDRIVKGGNMYAAAFQARSAARHHDQPLTHFNSRGFRVAIPVETVKEALKKTGVATANAAGWHSWPTDAPQPAIAPFDAAQAKKHQEEWAAYLKVPVEWENSLGMKFRLIPPGEFMMGSSDEEIQEMLTTTSDYEPYKVGVRSQAPRHLVVVSQPFYLGKHEVMQQEYEAVVKKNPSQFSPFGVSKDAVAGVDTAQLPVEGINWNDAVEFCALLREQSLQAGKADVSANPDSRLKNAEYRLPTEAEWEYACKAGTMAKCWLGDDASDRRQAAWFHDNAGGRTHAVGTLSANPFGLHDMHGNVWEWVQDKWAPTYSATSTGGSEANASPSPAETHRVLRGGSWYNRGQFVNATYRHSLFANFAQRSGLRVALTIEEARQDSNWHGWPADAPKPAIAPFDAEQAKRHQEEWAKHLGISVVTTNSVGAKMVLIPPGEFLMGAPEADTDATPPEKPQHRVTLTKPFAISATEITNRQFRQFVEATKYVTQAESDGQGAFEINPKVRRPTNTWDSPELRKKGGDEHPVRCVSWEDARRFCAWLSKTEGHTYRLPTEAEWEFACRAGTTTRYSFGDNLSDSPSPPGSSGAPLRAVAQLPANPFGLFDMHGSVNEFCLDSGRTYTTDAVTDPLGSLEIDLPAAVRGGAVSSNAARQRSSNRYLNDARRFPETNFATVVLGFRVVRDFSTAPPIAKAPFNAAQAKIHQDEWAAYLKVPPEWENSIGMKFRLIPPGEFLMGSTPEEIEAALAGTGDNASRRDIIRSEGPQHKVILTQPIYVGIHEVTQKDYRQIIGRNPSFFAATGAGKGDVVNLDAQRLPVEQVSWNDAAEFCALLSVKEELKPFYSRTAEEVTLLAGTGYRLPTEAEWEFACRAGTATKYWTGDNDDDVAQAGWMNGGFQRDQSGSTHPVGTLTANPLGLFDLHGNVEEWVGDSWLPTYYQQFPENPAIDPQGPSPAGPQRLHRGGNWLGPAYVCRSSLRNVGDPTALASLIGFRVAIPVNAVKQALAKNLPASTDAVDLLSRIQPTDALPVGWSFVADQLTSDPGVETANLPLTAVTSSAYKLTAEFSLEAGTDAIYFVLPLAEGRVCFAGFNTYPDGENPNWFGIGELNGKSIRETPQNKRHPLFRKESQHTVEIDVRSLPEETTFTVKLDDQQLAFSARTAELNISDEYRWPDKQKLGVGTVNSRYRILKMSLVTPKPMANPEK